MRTRVLVGEADRKLRRALDRTLVTWGMAPDSVGTKTELLDLARSNRYSIVLLDIDAACEDVVHLLHQLTALIAPRVRIVLLGSGAGYENARARSSGIVYIALRKPIAPDALRDVIDRFAVPVADA